MKKSYKISDIIEELKRLQIEHGNVDVKSLSYINSSFVQFLSTYPYFDDGVVKFGYPDAQTL